MKKISVLFALTILIFSAVNSQARNNTAHTTVTGAAGGALVGQAIGRNTESTLVGAAVGGVVGYIVGNEMDKHGHVRQTHYYPPEKVIHVTPPPRRPVTVVVNPGYGYKHHPRHYRHSRHWRGEGHKWGHYKHRYSKRHHHKKHHRSRGDNYKVVIW